MDPKQEYQMKLDLYYQEMEEYNAKKAEHA